MIFPSQKEAIEKCGWNLECEEFSKYIDFQLYLQNKQFIIGAYEQIKQHEFTIEFHPLEKQGILIMIFDRKKYINTLLLNIKNFKTKYNL